jgi:hypothetical protein
MKRREFIVLLGGATAWPLAVRARQHEAKYYRIAYLALLPGEDTTLMKPLLERLNELGYVEGKNMIFEYRSAEDHPERGYLPFVSTQAEFAAFVVESTEKWAKVLRAAGIKLE